MYHRDWPPRKPVIYNYNIVLHISNQKQAEVYKMYLTWNITNYRLSLLFNLNNVSFCSNNVKKCRSFFPLCFNFLDLMSQGISYLGWVVLFLIRELALGWQVIIPSIELMPLSNSWLMLCRNKWLLYHNMIMSCDFVFFHVRDIRYHILKKFWMTN